MTVKTARLNHPFPNDGPLMKWLLANAKPLIYNRTYQSMFDRDLAGFRRARDSKDGHGTIEHDLVLDNLVHAELLLTEGRSGYATMLTIGSVYLRETINARRILTIGTNITLPTIMTESLVGQNADKAIELPDILQPVIAGRRIKSYTQFDDWLTFELDNKPW